MGSRKHLILFCLSITADNTDSMIFGPRRADLSSSWSIVRVTSFNALLCDSNVKISFWMRLCVINGETASCTTANWLKCVQSLIFGRPWKFSPAFRINLTTDASCDQSIFCQAKHTLSALDRRPLPAFESNLGVSQQGLCHSHLSVPQSRVAVALAAVIHSVFQCNCQKKDLVNIVVCVDVHFQAILATRACVIR